LDTKNARFGPGPVEDIYRALGISGEFLGFGVSVPRKQTVDELLDLNIAKENENIKQWLIQGQVSTRTGRRWGKRQLAGQEAELISEAYTLTRTVFAFPGDHASAERELHAASEEDTGKVVLVVDKERP
jgi:hypothetical protein